MKLIQSLTDSQFVAKYLKLYEELESRDRIALTGLGIFFLVVIIVMGIWQPATGYAEKAQTSRDRQRELISWMKATESKARATAGSQVISRRSGQSLLTSVSKTAKTHKIQPNKLQPGSNDEVSVVFEAVAFNLLLSWLEDLQLEQGIHVRQISVDKHELPGTVSARIVLKNS
jgi:type II secretory pathway component PulM